jgi:hypothetical protein
VKNLKDESLRAVFQVAAKELSGYADYRKEDGLKARFQWTIVARPN